VKTCRYGPFEDQEGDLCLPAGPRASVVCLLTDQAARYQAASPRARLPLGVRQLVIHGTADDVVPIEIARSYTQAARAAGDRVDLLELPHTGHMDCLDPSSTAHVTLCDWLARM
jgi:pimeloyl-ACP methyl ester carboxylesterase